MSVGRTAEAILKQLKLYISGLVLLICGASNGFGATVSLSDWAFDVNGTDYSATNIGPVPPGILPGSINVSAFDLNTDGLGSVTISLTAGSTGNYTINAMLDYDLNAAYFNEYGATSGSAAAGEGWTIGNYTNLAAITLMGNEPLDNTNNVPGTTDNSSGTCVGPTCNADVFTGLGYTLNATAGQLITVTFTTSLTAPTGGFYLIQQNPNTQQDPNATTALYESATASVTGGGGGQTPEPGTWMLVSGALVAGGAAFAARRRANRA